MPLAFCAAILIFAFSSRINIGVRHILPIYVGFSICCGVAAQHLLRDPRRAVAGAVVALLGWQAVSGAVHHPDYIAYTNALAGRQPERVLADSDLDWEQGFRRLAQRLRELGVREITLKLNTAGYMDAGNAFPTYRIMPDGDEPTPGWNVICITPWKLSGQPRGLRDWSHESVSGDPFCSTISRSSLQWANTRDQDPGFSARVWRWPTLDGAPCARAPSAAASTSGGAWCQRPSRT